MNFNQLAVISVAVCMGTHSFAGKPEATFNPYPKNAGEAYTKLPAVKKGGTIYSRKYGNPKTINPITIDDVEWQNVMPTIFARFMDYDFDTNSYFPFLAEKLEVSKDHKVLTYTLRKDATWEDGSPITTDDVEFTFNTIMDKKVNDAFLRTYFEGYTFEKIDQQVFRFHIEKPNVNSINETNYDFLTIQKKQYEGVTDFNSAKQLMTPIGSGPYQLKSFSHGQKLELERRKDWWGYKIPQKKNLYNFDNIVYRIIPDTSLAYEKFVKGEIDVLEMNAEMFGTRVHGVDKDKFGTDANSGKEMWAEHFKTQGPVPYTYVAWNLKNPLFMSKKTRQALGHLVDYDTIISKAFYGEATRCASPFGTNTLNSYPDQKKKAYAFDVPLAIKMLKEDGWADTDGNNTLSKVIDGKKTKFEFVLRYNSENPMRAKVAQMIKETYAKAGVTVNIQAIEFNTLLTQVDNRDFEAVILSWGKGALFANTTQIWHSKSWPNKGSNMGDYSNPEADKLMDQSDSELDPKKRYQIVQKLGAMIYDDQPYAFLVENPSFMAGFHSRIKAKKWVMKYDDTPPIWQYYSE